MSLKPRYKRRIFWSIIITIGLLLMAIVLVPPMIDLNYLKPKIEQTISEQTGVNAKINGDIHFSLLGRATIVAHEVSIQRGTIGSMMFSVPLTSIFDIQNAKLSGDITIYNADLSINTLIPKTFGVPIEIHNSDVNFRNRHFEIINATLANGHLIGVIRTQNHKYDIDFENDEFYIRNQNDNLEISGRVFADGSASGQIAMETNEINRWFGFSEPKIEESIDLTMNFDWDGGRGWKFSNIKTKKLKGNITIQPNGEKTVELQGTDIDYDFTFLTEPSRIFYQTKFNLDFTGALKFGDHTFKHLKIEATGTRDALEITNIVADDIAITGGVIDVFGAHDLMITMPYEGEPATCLFYGTPETWKCERFSYDDYVGAISVSPEKFDLLVYSQKEMPERNDFIKKLLKLAPRGHMDFEFSNIAGTYDIDGDKIIPTYKFAQNKSLHWLDPSIKQIPQFMQNAVGNFSWEDDMMHFVPNSGRWELYLTDNYFYILGTNAKDWFPGIDLQALNNLEYTVSGTYNGENVSNLEIVIAGHTFTGSVTGKNITLHTDVLDIDSFLNQNYIDNYEELGYLTAAPITIPFSLPVNISLSADAMIYNGTLFQNFVYSLKPNIQTFSITDNDRGNLLATFKRDGNKYDIFAQLNRFVIYGNLLSSSAPLNIQDSMITAEINMKTFGNIAHDLEYNMSGNLDLTFEGGYLVGIGVDEFFASADTINTFNAEYALSYALESGKSAIKSMRVIGKYDKGNFETTKPIALRLRHTDATGELMIDNGMMSATFDLVLRGTSPVPAPIELRINSDNSRKYSLSEIMKNFDSTFMRDFVKTHNKF